MESIIKELLNNEGPICLSLILPLTYHSFPEKAQAATVLRKGVHEAEKLLHEQADTSAAKRIIRTLRSVVEELDLNHPPASIACFITPQFSRVIRFPISVTSKVVVSRTFELQDLLFNLDKLVPYHALHLSQGHTRLFKGLGPDLYEIINNDFPRALEPDHQYTKGSPYALYNADPSEVAQHRLENFLRQVCHLAASYIGEQPLVLLGVEKDVALYKKLNKPQYLLEHYVHGNYDKEPIHILRPLVWQLVAQAQQAKDQDLVARLRYKLARKEGVYGLPAVLQSLNQHTVTHLVVEKDFEIPGFFDPTTAQLGLQPNAPTAIAVSNLVEHILETVLRKPTGKVTLVAPGVLKDYEKIVATKI